MVWFFFTRIDSLLSYTGSGSVPPPPVPPGAASVERWVEMWWLSPACIFCERWRTRGFRVVPREIYGDGYEITAITVSRCIPSYHRGLAHRKAEERERERERERRPEVCEPEIRFRCCLPRYHFVCKGREREMDKKIKLDTHATLV